MSGFNSAGSDLQVMEEEPKIYWSFTQLFLYADYFNFVRWKYLTTIKNLNVILCLAQRQGFSYIDYILVNHCTYIQNVNEKIVYNVLFSFYTEFKTLKI